MGLYTEQEYEKTEMQKRIADSLNDKAKKARQITSDTDLIEDSAFVEGTKRTTSLAWAWWLIVTIFVGVAIWLVITGLNNR